MKAAGKMASSMVRACTNKLMAKSAEAYGKMERESNGLTSNER